jgi:hypothetical protein
LKLKSIWKFGEGIVINGTNRTDSQKRLTDQGRFGLGANIQEVPMLKIARVGVFAGLVIIPQLAFAEDNSTSRCVDVSVPRHAVEARNGRWIELTPEQWQFLRGIYAMNPKTPPGLPYGDKAVLAEVDGRPSGLVFFIDGDKACTPMNAPPQLVALMQDVATGSINHEGAGL